MLKKDIYEDVILSVDAMFDDGKMLKGSIAFVTKGYDIKLPEDKNKEEYILYKEEFTVEVKDDRAEYKFVIKDIIDDNNIRQEDIAYVKGWIDVDGEGEYDREYDLEVFLEVCKELITKEMLEKVAPNKINDKELLRYLNKYARIYEVDTKYRIAHFLSQIAHESKFNNIEESLNYNEKQMKKTFGCKGGSENYNEETNNCNLGILREKLWKEEIKYVNSPENLANYVYANRMGNGNEESGDGYKYRGRGMIQLTGKNNYKMFTDKHNSKNPNDIKDFVETPDLIISDQKYGIESAFVFWESKNINSIANGADVNTVTLKINGGLNGLSDRQLKFDNLIKIME